MDISLSNIKTIGVAGAGTMGLGIAQLAAQAGYKTVLYDINQESLIKAEANIAKNFDGGIKRGKLTEEDKNKALSLLTFTTDLNQMKIDLIIEAVIEKLSIKIDLFKKLIELNGDSLILASNTSSIPITQIAAQLPNPEQVVGMHFFNPAHIMKLVEVISSNATNKNIAKLIYDLAIKMTRKPVYVNDAPGFIVNRVARHYYLEAFKLLEEKVADIETVDELLQNAGFKMGPFKLLDLIGIDTNYAVTCSMFESFKQEARFRPNRIQEQKVLAGEWGRKSGKGFYNYIES